jgi:hypothetical protein
MKPAGMVELAPLVLMSRAHSETPTFSARLKFQNRDGSLTRQVHMSVRYQASREQTGLPSGC